MRTRSVELRSRWDASLLQTADLHPQSCPSVLLDFALDAHDIDAGLPPEVASALAHGLAAAGIVAGRWFERDDPMPADAIIVQPPPANPFQRVLQHLLHSSPVPVVVTRSPANIAALLDQGWSMQYQALLVFDPLDATPPEKALEALRLNRTWTAFTFPRPATALVAPGVDGDYVLIVGASEEHLHQVLGALAASFREAGFLFPPGNTSPARS